MGSPTVPIYRVTGQLVRAIDGIENVKLAQAYLTEHGANMEQYLWDSIPEEKALKDELVRLSWHLDTNGLDWHVEAIARRELTDAELKQLGEYVSGQNSDGLGEGFEQQDFAWVQEAREQDCSECDGSGQYEDPDGVDGDCPECEGLGYFEDDEGGHMASFDWKTNEHVFARVN